MCVYVLSFIKQSQFWGGIQKNIALPVLFLITVDQDGQRILCWADLAIDWLIKKGAFDDVEEYLSEYDAHISVNSKSDWLWKRQ